MVSPLNSAGVSLLFGILCGWSVAIVALRRSPLVNNRWNIILIAGSFAVLATLQTAYSTNPVLDRVIYARQFEDASLSSRPWSLAFFNSQPAFASFIWVLGHVAPPKPQVLFLAVGAAMSVGTLVAMRRLLSRWGTLFAWVTLLASGLFLSYSSVAIRQGLAMTCLVLAISTMLSARRNAELVAWLIMAGLFHWSALPFAIAILMYHWRRVGPKGALIAWLASAAIFVAGSQQVIVGRLLPYIPRADYYLSSEAFSEYGSGGSRVKFLAASAAIVAVFLLTRTGHGTNDSAYDRLGVIYIIFNCIFLLMGFVAYSDRLASYSWFLAPILFGLRIDVSRRQTSQAVAAASLACIGLFGLTIGGFGSQLLT